MIPRPPRSSRTVSLFPYPPLFRSEPPRCLHPHPLIDVQSGHGDLLHDCSRFSGIDEVQPARGWSKPHPAAIGIAGWTFHVIDQEDIRARVSGRSEEHTSELQSLMRISYAVFCLKKKI